MINITTKLHSLPEKRNEIILTIKELADQIGKSTKCKQIKIYQDIDDNNTFFLVEDWPTKNDLGEYLSSRLFKVLLGVHPILEYPLEIKLFIEFEKSHLGDDDFVKDL